jgi:H+-transporting ATPase
MYRIAETLRVLIFMTLAIVIFNFYPLTAVMIVILALLNDGAILSIVYDNVRYRNAPEAWNMRVVLGIATVLGLVGPIAAFGLFYAGDRVFHLSHPQLQTMMYLMLSVAGHLTIFQTRTRGPWWSTRPAWILLAAVCGTQAVATLIAVYGAGLVTPLGWEYAGIVWVYAFAWFLVTDPLKLLAYKVLDAVGADVTPRASIEAKVASIPASSPADKEASKPDLVGHPSAEANVTTKSESQDMSPPENQAAAKPDATPASAPALKPTAKVAPSAAPAHSKPEAHGASTAELGTMMKTMVGDLAKAGMLKDPERAGHLVAGAIIAAEAPVAAAHRSCRSGGAARSVAQGSRVSV